MAQRFTNEELRIAKSVDLCELARGLGYTPVKIGTCHTLKEMDSIRIYDKKTWYRWSDGSGGCQIDFLETFAGLGFVEAVKELLTMSGNVLIPDKPKPREKKAFLLPSPAPDNAGVIRYLMDKRKISEKTIDRFIGRGLIYEEASHHNRVFICRDKDGIPKAASMRGIYDAGGKPFKCDVSGSDKSYGFSIEAKGSDTIRVFEAAIDLMSFYDATGLKSDHLLALGMTADNALSRYLGEHKEIRNIVLSLDNDEPGINASEKLKDKYESLGYSVKNLGSPMGFKDYNEWLVASRSKKAQISGDVAPRMTPPVTKRGVR